MTEAAKLLDEWNGLADEWNISVTELKSKTRRCATIDAYCRAFNMNSWRRHDIRYELWTGTERSLNSVKRHIEIFREELRRFQRILEREKPRKPMSKSQFTEDINHDLHIKPYRDDKLGDLMENAQEEGRI